MKFRSAHWSLRIVAIYAVLLGLSWLCQYFLVPGKDSDGEYQFLSTNSGNIAYLDLNPAADSTPPVLILQNTVEGAESVLPLAQSIAAERRVLIPEMPGLGASAARGADVSTEGQARAALGFLDALDIEQADFIGHRLGAAVAAEVSKSHPSHVRSLVYHSGIGVQEYYLMGDYFLNHGLHATRLAALWSLRHLVPHFGLISREFTDPGHARKYLDSDLRPVREQLLAWQKPALIIHDPEDAVTSAAAAREHARLLPQSELVEVPENESPQIILSFLRTVDDGIAVTRVTSDPDRMAIAGEPFEDHREATATGVSLWIYLVLLAISTHISEDLACIAAGLLVADEILPLHWAILACFAGIYFGDIPVYLAGRWLGRAPLRKRPLRWVLNEERVDETAKFFDRYGASIIIITRFIPGTRLPTYFTAGVLGIPVSTFLLNFFIACAIWVPLMIWLASLLGTAMLDWFEAFRGYAIPVLFGIIAAVWIGLRLGGKAVKKKVHARHQ